MWTIIIRTSHNIAHATRAELSWHVKIRDLTQSLENRNNLFWNNLESSETVNNTATTTTLCQTSPLNHAAGFDKSKSPIFAKVTSLALRRMPPPPPPPPSGNETAIKNMGECIVNGWYYHRKNKQNNPEHISSWWRHQMETISASPAICAGNSPVPVKSPHKGQWRGALMFSLMSAWINDWVNNR